MSHVQLEPSWKRMLAPEFEKPYWKDLTTFVRQEIESGKKIYPPGPEIFAAFDLCPFGDVKVVILGQDPYHGKGQCHGPCFSVNPRVPFPPSLQNILKELKNEFPDFGMPQSGDLRSWCKQGVLMLNATLTVRAHEPMSHAGEKISFFSSGDVMPGIKKALLILTNILFLRRLILPHSVLITDFLGVIISKKRTKS